ncbi:MAG: hypothetical protein JWR03_2122 [Cohnella sp.]|nr:hypothetical protein [Cohnella sp.]
METAALLSPADINVIRRYVQTKYAPLPSGKRAEIVADAIRRTLEQRLPELPAPIKSRMSGELIRRCLLGERREVKPEDVLEFCAELDIPDSDAEQQLVTPMLEWMDERTPGLWSPEHVATRLMRRKIIPLPTPILEPETMDGQATMAMAVSMESNVAVQASVLPVAAKQQNRARSWTETIKRVPRRAWAAAVCVVVIGVIAAELLRPAGQASNPGVLQPLVIAAPSLDIGMPRHMKFVEINTAAVKAYLQGRDALLAEEPYFSAIVDSARTHDVNPLLLFAIVGQEEGFVPKTNKNAKQIANNPFNVFHSWQEYNTNIQDSSDIAALTISRRGQSRPEGHEPFEWFNKKYAEDPNWGAGVKRLFDKLTSLSPSR